jgi:hypothetical protein
VRDKGGSTSAVKRSTEQTAAAPARAPEELMEVQVRFYGIRVEPIDEHQTELQLRQGASIREVLHALGDRYGEKVRSRLFSADGAYLRDMLCVAVNGYIVGDAELDAPLPAQGQGKQRVELTLIYAIAGGAGPIAEVVGCRAGTEGGR